MSDYSLLIMTEKQEKILDEALRLFAENGYNATSTSQVAKAAGVSEGLIFRHYGNKEGLLQAIVKLGEESLKKLFAEIIFQTEPKAVIRKTIEMPFSVSDAEHGFWRLQYKLKWELKEQNHAKMEPLLVALTNAFKKLGYKQPELEAELLATIMDGIGAAILKGTLAQSKEKTKDFLLNKYGV